MKPEEILRMRKKLESLRKERDENTGTLKALQKTLSEKGIKDVKEAKTKMAKLEKKLGKLEAEIEEKGEALEEKYGEDD